MVDPIKIQDLKSGVGRVNPATMRPAQPRTSAAGASFKETLLDTVREVERLRNEADHTVKQLVSGEIKDVSEAMIAVQKADVAFQTLLTVRGKVMTAYEEIMRMQV